MANTYCEKAVDNLARYQSEWTNGFMELKFTRFSWSDQARGTLNYTGDTVKFQNGFGAWQNMVYVCTYDPANPRAATAVATPRNG